MTLRLNGATSGYVEIDAPAVAGNNTLALPTGNGSNGQQLTTDGAGVLSWAGNLTLMTSQATTSGTVIDFTGIPSWAKRISIIGASVSTNGTSSVIVQLGTSAGFTTSGYLGGTASALVTNGLAVCNATAAAATRHFITIITLLTGNQWVSSSNSQRSDAANVSQAGGSITLSNTLDRLRLTTVNGIDTFDSGSVNVMYEG